MASSSVVAISADIKAFQNAMNMMENQWRQTFVVARDSTVKANLATQKYENSLIQLGKEKSKLAGITNKNSSEYREQKAVVNELTVATKQLNIERATAVREASSLKTSTNRAQRDLDWSRKQLDYERKHTHAIREANAALKDKLLITSKAEQIERKYKNLIKETNYYLKKGVITRKQATLSIQRLTLAQKQEILASKRSNLARHSATNDLVRHIRQLETLVIALYTVKSAYDYTLGMGHEFNKMVESEQIGIALSIVQKLKDVDVTGKQVTQMEKWAYANQKAKEEMEEVRKINPFTPHTLEQTIQLYKTISNQVRANKGNMEDSLEATKNLSIVAKAGNVEFKQMLKTVDQLYAGRMKPSDMQIQLVNMLNLTQKQIRAAQKAGKAVEFVNEKLRKAKIAATAVEQSWEGVMSNFINAWTDIVATAQSPLFEAMKKQLKELTIIFVKNKDKIVGAMLDIGEAIKENWDLSVMVVQLWAAKTATVSLTKAIWGANTALFTMRKAALGSLGLFLFFVDEVDSVGGAVQRLTDYFRLGFASIKHIGATAFEWLFSLAQSFPEFVDLSMKKAKLAVANTMNDIVRLIKDTTFKIRTAFELVWAYIIKDMYSFKADFGKAINEYIIKPWNEAVFKMKLGWYGFKDSIGMGGDKPLLTTDNLIDISGAGRVVSEFTTKIKTLKDKLSADAPYTQDALDTTQYKKDADEAAKAFKKAFDDPDNAPWFKEMKVESYSEMIDAFTKLNTKTSKTKHDMEAIAKLTKILFDDKPDKPEDEDDGGKGARLKDKMAKEYLQALKLQNDQKLVQYKIDLKNGKYLFSLESDSLKIFKMKAKLAKELADETERVQGGTKTAVQKEKIKLDLLKAQNKELDEMTKEMKKWENVFSSIFSGDFVSAINTAFGETFTKLSESIGNMAGGVGSVMSSVVGGITSAGISLALEAISTLFSSHVTQAEIDAAKGRTDFDDESIKNSLDILASTSYPLLEATYSMDKHLRAMDNNFVIIAKKLSGSTSGLDVTGANFVETFTEGFLGFSSKKVSLISTGLAFDIQTLGEVLDTASVSVRGYTTTLVEKTSWFGFFSSSKIRETYQDLPQETKEAFAESFAYGYEAILVASAKLGFNQTAVADALAKAELEMGTFDEETGQWKIDLEGLNTQEIADRLSAAFSTAFSGIIDDAEMFDSLMSRYGKASEDQLETLIRIAVEYEQATHSFMLIGKEFSDTATRIDIGDWGGLIGAVGNGINGILDEFGLFVYTSQEKILDIVDAIGGLDAFNDAMSSFVTGFYSEDEQKKMLEKSLQVQFDTLGMIMPETNAGFRDLIENFQVLNKEDAETYAQLLLLSNSFAELNPLLEEVGNTIKDLALYIEYIETYTGFKSRKIALGEDGTEMALYTIEANKWMLSAVKAETELHGITMDNYLTQLEMAHLAGDLTSEQLDKWNTLGDAIMNVAEAQKAYTDILKQDALDELSFHQDILSKIEDAYSGTLSYLNSVEKANYLDRMAQLKLSSGDSQGYFDTLYKQLEFERSTSVTEEAYMPKFERYIVELQKAEPEEDPVVETLGEILIQNERIETAIKKASFQKEL